MNRFKKSLLMAATFLALVATGTLATLTHAAEAAKKIRVLLVTGDDVSVHPWPQVSQAIKGILNSTGRFEVRVCEDPGVIDSAQSLTRYDLIFLQYFNAQSPTLSAAAKENLLSFVSNGKGLTVAHLSSASFKEWPELRKLRHVTGSWAALWPRPARRLQGADCQEGPPDHRGLGGLRGRR